MKLFPIRLALCLVFLSTMAIACQASQQQDPSSAGWTSLFNGKDLSGWKQVNGTAPYKVVDGAIVGTTVTDSPNSFLATEKEYEDFILEFEFKLDNDINSGVQFRSISDPAIQDGRVHGYQFEIDPSSRSWTGGIYDEARRGWVYPLSLNPSAQTSFKKDAWNKARIESIGPNIRTWLNGVPVAHLVDTLKSKGIIALQVHSIGDKKDSGKDISWRNIRIKTDGLTHQKEHNAFVVNFTPNQLSKEEREQGWQLLWDGKTSGGWKGAKSGKFPPKSWEIKNGELKTVVAGEGGAVNGEDIITEKKWGAFELQLQFKLSEGANSGIKYAVTEKSKDVPASPGLEYQLLDDEKHPDAKGGRDGNRTLASLYDLKTAEKQSRFLRPIGEWNQARIVVYPDNKVEHWLNGIKVLEYVRGSQEFRELVANSKFKDMPNYGEAANGHLLLQHHGDPVAFRSIKIRELK